jgi:hypothetical protein
MAGLGATKDTLKSVISCTMTPHSLLEFHRNFENPYFPHLQGELIMAAYPLGEDNIFLRSVTELLPNYTASHW